MIPILNISIKKYFALISTFLNYKFKCAQNGFKNGNPLLPFSPLPHCGFPPYSSSSALLLHIPSTAPFPSFCYSSAQLLPLPPTSPLLPYTVQPLFIIFFVLLLHLYPLFLEFCTAAPLFCPTAPLLHKWYYPVLQLPILLPFFYSTGPTVLLHTRQMILYCQTVAPHVH